MKNSQSPSGAIAIIGMSGRYPGGANSPEELWQLLVGGTDAVTEAKGDRWDLGWHHPDARRPGRIYTTAGGYLDRIDGFDAEFFGMSPREVRQVDPQQRLLLELAWELHEDAGIAPSSTAGSDCGVFVGISSNDYANMVGPEWPDAYSNTGSSFSIAANRISYIFDLHGPSVAVDTACSSSIVCVHQACQAILAGECSTAMAGGVSILTHIRPWLGFAKASMLSPTGRCKSFDASGDGYVRSEGGGLVLLKRLEDAERDGNTILGVILATGVNSDGRTMGLSMPNGDAQEALLRTVYDQCGVRPEEVFYVEAHGTGTAVGDPIECGALGRVLGTPRADGSTLLMGSVKSNIGHLEAASGIAGLTKVLLSLKHRMLPANLHFNEPNPKIEFEQWRLGVVAAPTPLPAEPVTVGINSFGFGGTNAHMVMREYQPVVARGSEAAPARAMHLLVLSAQSDAALREVAARYAARLRSADEAEFATLCAAAATGRELHGQRLVIAAATAADAIARLDAFAAGEPAGRLATGIASGSNAPIAFVYSGNGPQWWGMGRELLQSSATFRAEVEAVDAIFAPLSGWSLLDEMRRPESESRIALTEVAQPMLFAMQLGLTQALRASGIEAAAVFGHSVGEAAAAWASGALTREQATTVIYHRSQQQARTAGMGKMAAIGASADEVRAAMAKVDGWLELAAINSPSAVTVAGDPVALEQLVADMTAAGKFARTLVLNYPFHTKAMDIIHTPLLDALRDLAPAEATVPFISTVTGRALAGTQLDAEYWYRNIREAVQFDGAVMTALKEKGIATYIEVGPHPVLKDYVLQSAKAASVPAVALPTLKRPGAKGPEVDSENLWVAVCACLANGAGDVAHLYTRPVPMPALPLYPWQHTRHWRGAAGLPDATTPTAREHVLLGHRVSSAVGLWQNAIDTNQLPYLVDHVVQDAVLFPAAGYIDMALEAGRLAFGGGVLDVENVDITRPLTIAAHGDPLVQTSVDVKDGTVEVHSKADRDAADWTLHFRGRLSRNEVVPAPQVADLAAIEARTPVSISAEAHYADSLHRGLAYGPQFQGVRSVRLTESDAAVREALAELHLALDTTDYLAHPSLLDSAIQVLITLIAQNEPRNVSTIPVQIGRVRSYAPLAPQMRCQVIMRRETERSATAEFRIMAMDGTLLMVIEDARCQKVDFNAAAPTPRISEWWRPDPTTQPLEAPAALAPVAQVAMRAAAELPRIIAETAREEYYREIQPMFEKLAGAYASAAIAALEPGEGSFDAARLARRAGVKREHMALLSSLIEMSASEGQVVAAGAAFRWNGAQDAVDATALWRELFQRHPRYHAELLLLASAGEELAAKLRGEATADTRGALLDQLQDNAPFQAPYNQAVRAVLEQLVALWPAERPMRILEVNGAGAGLLSWVLPVLPAYRADYVFSDASEGAVARAEHRFSSHRALRFETVDLSRDLLEQGQPAGFYDLVIGANVLDGSSEMADVLARLQRVMTPDAQLLLLQVNADRFATIVLGTKAFDAAAVLVESGFEAPVVIDDAAACLLGQLPRQSLLLASRVVAPMVVGREVAAPARRWMFVVEKSDLAFTDALVASMTLQGQRVVVRDFGDAERLQEAVAEAVAEEPVDEIVCISSPVGGDLFTTQSLRTLTAAHLVQALEASPRQQPTLLTLVTRGAFPTANGQGPLDPAQAPLWGLGRVIGNEHTSLKVRMIDVHTNDDDARCLVTELLRRDDETEVQLHRGHRYANRQRMNSAVELAQQSGDKPEAYALDFLPQGGLDSLHLRPAERRAPASHEVEIAVKAAGLNFRDVLWSMGMLPEEAVEQGFSGPTIGMECAGEVVRVGDGVTTVTVGDRVVAFASNCFGSHVTTDAGSVAVMPAHLDYASAATIPTAFLTAYYAFDHLARLEPGEVVLIHGAAGGVGMAAIQIAKLKGATVIGTAGTARKRRMLEMLGVDHALSSRSLDFADQVMQITKGVGVDVVLNSLAGEAITKSLQCLRPFGRFLEIGKRDLYANSRIGLRPFRINLSYFGIDADTLLVERADLARKMFHAVMGHFASGALKPIPFQEIPISRASEAFRAMQKSSHVGKLVVSMQLDRPALLPVARKAAPVKPVGTYLVTGGLGGFGLATARWLVDQGATSLALLSRRGATTDEARDGIAAMEAQGAVVRAFACDIADMASLEMVLATIRTEMAPLTGVVHSAAVIEDAPVLRMEAAQVARVFLPKLVGAWNLHVATRHDPIDMFVMYSSSSASVGNPGQGAYVAANLYLDALAMQRHAMGLPALAVGWGAIKDAGFLTRHTAVAGMLKSRTGMDATPSDEALADLGALCSAGAVRMNVARFDLVRLGQMLPGARVPRFLAVIPKGAAAASQSDETLADLHARTPEGERGALVLARVRDHAARVLGTSAAQVSVDQPLSNLGLDSLMAVELAGGLERDLGQPISVMQMLSAGSLVAIADLVSRMLVASGEGAPVEAKV